jgi:hypothetical protein
MLARFERLMEQAVEGSLRRVFPVPIEPVQLAKAAARAMEQAQVVGVRGREVPNCYELRLAPADLARFGDYSSLITDQVGAYLVDYARDRGLRPVAEPRVELIADDRVSSGQVRAKARFADLAAPVQHEVETAIESTRRLRLADLASASPGSRVASGGELCLVDVHGGRWNLDPELGLIRVGRATDNDVVIASKRVSRYHAQLRWVQSVWLVYDLDSTNGTWLDAERVRSAEPRAMQAGSSVRLGDQRLDVRGRA